MFLIAITVSDDFSLHYHSLRIHWGLMFSGRPMFLSFICLELYLSVVHPVTFLRYKPLRYKVAAMTFSWLTLSVFCIIFLWVPYPEMFSVLFGAAIPWFPCSSFFTVETLRTVVRPGPGEDNQGRNGMSSAKRYAFKIIIVATALYNMSYVFSIVLFGHTSIEDSYKMFCISYYVSLMAFCLPSLFYFHRVRRLQNSTKDAV